MFLPDLRVHHTLTKHDDVWLTSLSRRYPQEYLEVERRVKRQDGPSLNPAPLARIEWVIWIGFGWCQWIQVQNICPGLFGKEEIGSDSASQAVTGPTPALLTTCLSPPPLVHPPPHHTP